MAYSGNLISINGVSMAGKVKEYKISYAKLWADADRNMDGQVRATLIGIFPKIQLVFKEALTQAEISQIAGLLNIPYFPVTYFDPKTQGTVTANYYASDYDVDMLDKTRGFYKSFNVSLVPVGKVV